MATKTEIQAVLYTLDEALLGDLIDHIAEVNFLDISEAVELIYTTELADLLDTMVTSNRLKARIKDFI